MSSMSMKAGGIFQFGEFQIDARARTLRREEEIVTLSFRAFDVLPYFVQNPGKVLTRDELLKNVWPDSFVDEDSLAQSISMLRPARRPWRWACFPSFLSVAEPAISMMSGCAFLPVRMTCTISGLFFSVA